MQDSIHRREQKPVGTAGKNAALAAVDTTVKRFFRNPALGFRPIRDKGHGAQITAAEAGSMATHKR